MKDIHKNFFQDIYDWAGQERTYQTQRGGHRFEWPEKIEKEANRLLSDLKDEDHLKDLDRANFIKRAALYFGELNVIIRFQMETAERKEHFLMP